MKSTMITVLKITILVILFLWIVAVFTDYFMVRKGKEPLFCLSETVTNYKDGNSTICTGVGYKAIRYNRTCLTATEFGPFTIEERQCE